METLLHSLQIEDRDLFRTTLAAHPYLATEWTRDFLSHAEFREVRHNLSFLTDLVDFVAENRIDISPDVRKLWKEKVIKRALTTLGSYSAGFLTESMVKFAHPLLSSISFDDISDYALACPPGGDFEASHFARRLEDNRHVLHFMAVFIRRGSNARVRTRQTRPFMTFLLPRLSNDVVFGPSLLRSALDDHLLNAKNIVEVMTVALHPGAYICDVREQNLLLYKMVELVVRSKSLMTSYILDEVFSTSDIFEILMKKDRRLIPDSLAFVAVTNEDQETVSHTLEVWKDWGIYERILKENLAVAAILSSQRWSRKSSLFHVGIASARASYLRVAEEDEKDARKKSRGVGDAGAGTSGDGDVYVTEAEKKLMRVLEDDRFQQLKVGKVRREALANVVSFLGGAGRRR